MDLLWQAIEQAIALILRRDPELIRIASLSLLVSASATAMAAMLGIPLAVALELRRFRGKRIAAIGVNAGMGLPPVVVGLIVTLILWRTGPLGGLRLLFTAPAMVVAQVIVAMPLIAGFTRAALGLLDADIVRAMRVDGARDVRIGRELVVAAGAQVLVAVAAGFGRAISEVGASLMVGGNIVGQTRILTTTIALETSRGEFALALALGFVLVLLAFVVNAALAAWSSQTDV